MMRRASALLLTLAVLFSYYLPSHAASAPRGRIRVLLSEHQGKDRLSLGIYGSYLLNGQLSFQSGAELRLSSESGSILVFYEGAAYRAGNTLRLVRHALPEGRENGLRLEGSLRLMEGDLDITLEQGKLRPVLSIGIEDYLKGVVPYEMSDSFPIEALKAQAVAARTYALRGLRGDRDFDVYSSTMDQVYLGLDAENRNALKAVEETRGIALFFGKDLAACYYTASNGGQTESAFNAWGRERISYLLVKDDPYDAANPMSIWKSYRIPKDASQLDEQLRQMLIQALLPKLKEMGYLAQAEALSIDRIVGLTAEAPRHPEPSRLMTKLSFELMVSARSLKRPEQEAVLFSTANPNESSLVVQAEPAAMERLAKPIKLTLPIYPDLEKLMQLSINIKENETVEVQELADAFQIRFGRYGHGVGMSQRGAEWMASEHGKSYREILAFYYPGTTERKHELTPDPLPTLAQDYLTTPGPRPTATPKPTLVPLLVTPAPGQWVVQVTGIAKNSSLNLREEPSLSAKVIQPLFYGQQLLVVREEKDGWLKVSAEGIEGYVMASFTHKVE